MHHARSILLATILLLLGLPPPGAAENSPPAPTTIGKSEKVCQLTGDVDWETGQPTAARTLTNFGLDAVDLGYPVEHDGKLFLLFGDTRPTTHSGGRGPAAEIPPDDSVGFTNRRAMTANAWSCSSTIGSAARDNRKRCWHHPRSWVRSRSSKAGSMCRRA